MQPSNQVWDSNTMAVLFLPKDSLRVYESLHIVNNMNFIVYLVHSVKQLDLQRMNVLNCYAPYIFLLSHIA